MQKARRVTLTHKLFVLTGALICALAVAFGAFGAHALKARLAPDAMAVYQTAVQYHFYHALGLVLVGLAVAHWPDSGWIRASGWTMLTGIVLFSGSLYLLALTGQRWLGAVTPVGGLAFIASWVLLAVGAFKGS
ncbi:MAG: hypothetical protein AMS22_15265 [Thiotrichales bacterium SG8_50]|nr:MAG: hypothetical protein AMS22_15265 [Thiotrichales bacterium SG8_50]